MSNPSSGSSTPNPRFTKQAKTTEDLLATQTVGLVALSDFRKRRAEAIEAKERNEHESLSGRATPSDGASTPKEPVVNKKKRKVKALGTPKLSFGDDEEEGGGGSADGSSTSTRASTPVAGAEKKKAVNASVTVVPKALTKGALIREAQEREGLRKEFLARQEAVKGVEIAIPFVFYDGTNIPGGVCKVKKGDFVWVFLDRSRKVGAELGVGKEGGSGNSRREWARVGVDDLMLVRGSLIIPHHYSFYYFIMDRTLGPNNRVLFDYSSEPPTTTTTTSTPEPLNLDNYNPLSRPSTKTTTETASAETEKAAIEHQLEGMNDDPTFTKVVDRRWYERNKHIFPASVWQTFDSEKDYQKEIRRDVGGNAFFYS